MYFGYMFFSVFSLMDVLQVYLGEKCPEAGNPSFNPEFSVRKVGYKSDD